MYEKLDNFGTNFHKFWKRFGSFFYSHKNLFDSIFDIIYLAEQVLLFILTWLFKEQAHFIVGLFVIIFFFTFNLHKRGEESRTVQQQKALQDMRVKYAELFVQSQAKDAIIESLLEERKDLNNLKTNKNKRGQKNVS